MRNRDKRRIFLGVQEIAGMLERLNNAFHEMGMESDFYCMARYKFSEEAEEENMPILKKYFKHTDKRIQATKEYERNWWYFLQMWDILYIFFHVLFRYDCFIYIFGHGMFFYNKYLKKVEELEFFLLKLFRKKMVMWFCGSDSRPPYCNGAFHFNKTERLYAETKRRENNIHMLEKYMVLIDYPASSHFHTKPYVIYNCIGVPIDEKEKVRVDKKTDNKLRILHAPSNQQAKGTEIIRNIVKEIEAEGYEFEYIEVSGMPHNTVLEEMALSDIVIDQLYADTPLAGFATEAAINGVPVIVGGYFADVYKKILPRPIAPTVYCTPEEFKEKIIYLIEHEEERIRIGREEKEYVENHNLAAIVAQKFLRIFEDSYPEEWVMLPTENDYIWGYGMDKKGVTDNIVRLIDKYGPQGLCLDENSILYKLYIQQYNEEKAKGN